MFSSRTKPIYLEDITQLETFTLWNSSVFFRSFDLAPRKSHENKAGKLIVRCATLLACLLPTTLQLFKGVKP